MLLLYDNKDGLSLCCMHRIRITMDSIVIRGSIRAWNLGLGCCRDGAGALHSIIAYDSDSPLDADLGPVQLCQLRLWTMRRMKEARRWRKQYREQGKAQRGRKDRAGWPWQAAWGERGGLCALPSSRGNFPGKMGLEEGGWEKRLTVHK
jgi:hypothetical protein